MDKEHSITHWLRHMLASHTRIGEDSVFGAVHHLVLVVLCALVLIHLGFMVYFQSIGVSEMALFNVLSVSLYLGCAFHKARHQQSHDLMIALIVLEVCAHAVAATYYVGWQAGYAIYVMAITPILAVMASASLLSRLLAIAFLSTTMLCCDWFFAQHQPPYALSTDTLNFTRRLNYANALLVLACAAVFYQYLLFVANRQLNQLASEDQLTGLLNRRAIHRDGDALAANCAAIRVPVCAAIGDLDHFKAINDEFGHDTGDEVLKAVAQAIEHNNRTGVLSGRWGGEEFVWLLPNTTEQQAQVALERLRLAVSRLRPARSDTPWRASISIGLAQLAPGERFEEAISRADSALYRAKDLGRDRIEVADSAPSAA